MFYLVRKLPKITSGNYSAHALTKGMKTAHSKKKTQKKREKSLLLAIKLLRQTTLNMAKCSKFQALVWVKKIDTSSLRRLSWHAHFKCFVTVRVVALGNNRVKTLLQVTFGTF